MTVMRELLTSVEVITSPHEWHEVDDDDEVNRWKNVKMKTSANWKRCILKKS